MNIASPMIAHLRKGYSAALFTVFGFSLQLQADNWEVERLAYGLETAEGPVWDAQGKLYITTQQGLFCARRQSSN